MGLPEKPITLSANQIARLNDQLAEMRHAVNNHLALMVAATEMMRLKPEMAPAMAVSLAEQPGKITKELRHFSDEFERTLNITQD